MSLACIYEWTIISLQAVYDVYLKEYLQAVHMHIILHINHFAEMNFVIHEKVDAKVFDATYIPAEVKTIQKLLSI